MGFTRKPQAKVQQEPLPALALGTFVTLGGMFLIYGGLFAVRSGNTPLWLAWALVGSGLLMAVGGLTDALRALQRLRN